MQKLLKYRPELDGLRAIAVIAVIINHFNKSFLPGGYLGVDCFFVISGYVITSSLIKRESNSFTSFIGSFYERRVKRLLPSLVTYVVIFSLLICFFSTDPGVSLKTGTTAIFGLSNIFIYISKLDYWGFQSEINPFLNTWSLGVEEQFYLIYPLIFWQFKNQINKFRKYLFYFLVILSAISLLYFIYMYNNNFDSAYYLMPSRFWEIGIGCICSLIISNKKNTRIKERYCYQFVFMIGFSLLLILPISFGRFATIGMVALTSIAILQLNEKTFSYRLLTNRILLYLGKISYSLYLWHWGVIVISKWTVGVYWWTIPIQLLLILACSSLNYHFIEQKFRYIELKKFKLSGIKVAGLITILTSTIPVSLGLGLNQFLYLGSKPNINVELKPSIKTFYVFGDSHAMDLVNIIGKTSNFKVKRLDLVGCTFYDNYLKDNVENKCKIGHKSNENFILKNATEGDLVILASVFFNYLYKENLGNAIPNQDTIKGLSFFLDSFIYQLSKKNVDVILKTPYPYIIPNSKIDGQLCKKEFFRPVLNKSCYLDLKGTSKEDHEERRKVLDKLFFKYELKYDNLHLWDITNSLCPDNICYPYVNGSQYYKDQHHLAIYNNDLNALVMNSLIRTINLNIK